MIEAYCLALALYHEARGEPLVGQIAVAQVVLNRVMDKRYPNTICAVVKQKKAFKKAGNKKLVYYCQFTFYCDGKSDKPNNKSKFKEMLDIANAVTSTYLHVYDKKYQIIEGATHYHHIDILPKWAKNMTEIATINNHIFYKLE
jgi:spore germination cell wall hydrolase CwlJ-like protein